MPSNDRPRKARMNTMKTANKYLLAMIAGATLLASAAFAAPGNEQRGGHDDRRGNESRSVEPRGAGEMRGGRDPRDLPNSRMPRDNRPPGAVVRAPANGYIFDSRFHHDRYYPPRGYVVSHLDRDARVVFYGNDRYYYRGGAWYRPFGARWRVVAPPIGLVVPFLPDFYTTIWFGGLPYYYANDSYYLWRREANGYVVVDPPETARSTSAPAADPADDLYVYPIRGQSDDLQSRDRYECHRWAISQTGFDPSEPGGGVPESQNVSKRADYRRAITACLEGRGYSVK